MGYLQIFFAAVWGVIFFLEIPDGWGVTGAFLIIGGTLGIARTRAGGAAVPGNGAMAGRSDPGPDV